MDEETQIVVKALCAKINRQVGGGQGDTATPSCSYARGDNREGLDRPDQISDIGGIGELPEINDLLCDVGTGPGTANLRAQLIAAALGLDAGEAARPQCMLYPADSAALAHVTLKD
jgi:hypothetical protein